MIAYVTGATGLVGAGIVSALEKAGHSVVGMQRSAMLPNGIRFDLGAGEPLPDGCFRSCDVLVHCAYDRTAVTADEVRRRNIEPSIRLIDEAHRAGVRKIIFISSISAFESCRSIYGRGKLEVEAYARHLGAVVVRPGLVYGDERAGMVPTLARLARRLPLVPVFSGGGQPFYLIHRDDLGAAIASIAISQDEGMAGAIMTIAHPEAISFSNLLKLLASSANVGFHSVSIPGELALFGLKVVEKTGLRLPFTSDNLLGMLSYNHSPDFSWLDRLELMPRNFSDYLHTTQTNP